MASQVSTGNGTDPYPIGAFIIAALLNDAVDVEMLMATGFSPDMLTGDPRRIWDAMDATGSTDLIELAAHLGDPVLGSAMMSWSHELDSSRAWKEEVEALKHNDHNRTYIEVLEATRRSIEADDPSALADAESDLLELMQSSHEHRAGGLDAIIEKCRLDPDQEPPPLEPIYRLGNHPVATAGNVVAVAGQSKTGKTAFNSALIAAPMDPEGDVLGLEARNPDGLALIHFDTEQSDQDHHRAVRMALRRSGKPCPDWFSSFHLLDIELEKRLTVIERVLEQNAKAHGGVFAVIIDGIGDLILDPNDPGGSFRLVDHLHQLANRYQTAIFCVLHFNPSTEGKMRGHLGSQLERRAETNLTLEKDGDGITTVFATRARHCEIQKADGPRFAWDHEAGMHLSCESARAAMEATQFRPKIDIARARQLFDADLPWKENMRMIADDQDVSSSTLYRHRNEIEDR